MWNVVTAHRSRTSTAARDNTCSILATLVHHPSRLATLRGRILQVFHPLQDDDELLKCVPLMRDTTLLPALIINNHQHYFCLIWRTSRNTACEKHEDPISLSIILQYERKWYLLANLIGCTQCALVHIKAVVHERHKDIFNINIETLNRGLNREISSVHFSKICIGHFIRDILFLYSDYISVQLL